MNKGTANCANLREKTSRSAMQKNFAPIREIRGFPFAP
jgi:hypothetical protein